MGKKILSETWSALSVGERLDLCRDFSMTEQSIVDLLHAIEWDFRRFYFLGRSLQLSAGANNALIALEGAVGMLMALEDGELAEVAKRLNSWLKPGKNDYKRQIKALDFDIMVSGIERSGRGARLTHGDKISRLSYSLVASWSETTNREPSVGSSADNVIQFLKRTLPTLRVLRPDHANATPPYESLGSVTRDCLDALPLAVRRYRRNNP